MKSKLHLLLLLFIVAASCKKSSDIPFDITGIDPMTDGPGATVTVRGNGFGNNASSVSVIFNTTIASLVSVSDTMLVVTVPPGATTGKIKITVNGNSQSSNDDFVILSGGWLRKADLPGEERADAVAFSIGEKGYVATGFNGGTGLQDIYEYDPSTDAWMQKASIPADRRYRSSAMAIGNKGYIICGEDPDYDEPLKEVWEYDPATDIWTRKNDFPGEGREGAAAFAIGNKGYFGTGRGDGQAYFNDWWEYDPAADTWIQKADFPGIERDYAMALAIGNKGYLGLAAYVDAASRDWWEYDPSDDTWIRKADFPGKQKGWSVCFAIGNKAYVAAGTEDECWEYDPSTNAWIQKTSHPTNRLEGVAFSIGDKGYVGTGSSRFAPLGYLSTDFWEFSPE
jgi:N-acetylneuraminic acid mutarotase